MLPTGLVYLYFVIFQILVIVLSMAFSSLVIFTTKKHRKQVAAVTIVITDDRREQDKKKRVPTSVIVLFEVLVSISGIVITVVVGILAIQYLGILTDGFLIVYMLYLSLTGQRTRKNLISCVKNVLIFIV